VDLLIDALHVLAACVWVGGSVTIVAVAVPYGRRLPPRERAMMLAGIGRRWRPIGWSALAVLVVTGLAAAHEDGGFSDSRFGRFLAAKVAVVGVLLLVTALHDFVVAPRLRRRLVAGEHPSRRPAVLLGWASLLLTLAAPVLGVALAAAVPGG
jgi:uncharacterized membrane protein